MSLNAVIVEKRRLHSDVREDTESKSRRGYNDVIIKGHRVHIETEKRARREIANSNERRRMQSINAGFEALKRLLPPVQDGEKISKANTLQLAAQYLESALMQLTVLKEQLALYQRSEFQPKNVLTEIHDVIGVGFCQKRKSDQSDVCENDTKIRKSNLENESAFLETYESVVSGQSSGCSPSAPSNCFGITPFSDESASNTAARLEHLVMAIEQIEGARSTVPQQIVSPLYLNHQDYSEGCLPSRLTSVVNVYKSSTGTGQIKSSISPFIEEFISSSPSSVSVTTTTSADLSDDGLIRQKSIKDNYFAIRSIGKPIPHKYLHRPQVVANNFHIA